jgi:hypothetical protein
MRSSDIYGVVKFKRSRRFLWRRTVENAPDKKLTPGHRLDGLH